MPRTRRTNAAAPVEEGLPGLDDLVQDPAPAPRRSHHKARAMAAPAKRAPGRPRGTGPRTSAGRLMSKAAMQAKVSAELYTYLSVFAAAWELRDPQCASVLFEEVRIPTEGGMVEVERLQGIVDRLVAMIARNSTVLETMAKSGIIGEMALLGHLLLPLGRAVWSAHGPTGVGHRAPEGNVSDNAERYPPHRAPVGG